MVGEEEDFIVEKIIGHLIDKKNKKLFYKIKWLGYDDPKDDTFEPIENLNNVIHMIWEYNKIYEVDK